LRRDRAAERFFVHETDHEHASACVVLNHSGHEPVKFRKIKIHVAPVDNKKARLASGGLPFQIALCAKESARRHKPPVVMMAMARSGGKDSHGIHEYNMATPPVW
jgi:hypothetical protein